MAQKPERLGERGSSLWDEITKAHTLQKAELELLVEACRCADRLEKLDEFLTGDRDSWFTFEEMKRDDTIRVLVDAALSEARQQQNMMKQLIASLRLPDATTGKKPQTRPGPSGSRLPAGVSSLDRARASSGS